jgi:hypothetical protein
VIVSIPHRTSVAAVFVLGFFAWSSFSLGSGAVRSLTPRLVPLDQLRPPRRSTASTTTSGSSPVPHSPAC